MSRRKTTEQFIEEAKKIHGDKYDYSLVEYKNAHKKVKIKCSKHGIFEQTPHSHLKGANCTFCTGKTINLNLLVNDFVQIHGDKYNYKYLNYIKSNKKITIICNKCGNRFKQSIYVHKNGGGCPKCSGKHQYSTEEFIKKAVTIHGKKFTYDNSIYVNSKTKIKIICNKCQKTFEQKPYLHLTVKNSCPYCERLTLKKVELGELLTKFKSVHGDRYDYSLIDRDILININKETKIDIICKKHGVFTTTINIHKNGSNCPKCAIEKNIDKRAKIGKVAFVKSAKEIHCGKYDYSLVNYKNNNTKVKIICPEHGVFEQTPAGHLRGGSCTKCRGFYKSTSDIIKEFKVIHGNKYDYHLVDYKDSVAKVKIICHKHGVFEQRPSDHLQSHGCPKCGVAISIKEQEMVTWIKDVSNELIVSNKRFYYPDNNKRFYELDIYIPSLKLGVEYNGLEFHHTFGNSYKGTRKWITGKDKYYHRDKSNFFQENFGIRIIHIWENEWIEKKEIIKNILSMQLYLKRKKIFARKCELKKINQLWIVL